MLPTTESQLIIKSRQKDDAKKQQQQKTTKVATYMAEKIWVGRLAKPFFKLEDRFGFRFWSYRRNNAVSIIFKYIILLVEEHV